MKKNGTVYIADPNFNPLTRVIANTIVFRISKKGDVKVYSEKELKNFFVKAGFAKAETDKNGIGIILKATR